MATGVALGAMAAHALSSRLDAELMKSFETGVRYQLIHGLALIILPIVLNVERVKDSKYIFRLLLWGTVCFSGSIYLLATKSLFGNPNILEYIWPITPIGGVLLILGWIFTFFSLIKNR